MRSSRNRFFALFLYALAMAYLEAAVVVYLRQAYYPQGFNVPVQLGFPYLLFRSDLHLPPFPSWVYVTELGREAATIVMLGAVGFLAGKSLSSRFGAFIFMFGVWDIFYYVFLKAIVNWPPSLLTLDVLFLIPVPWIAPVIIPILISCLFVLGGGWLFSRS
jgi:hypothetical protein